MKNEQIYRIADLLIDSGTFVTTSEIAARMNLSAKTIQRSQMQLESILEYNGLHLECVKGKGYRAIVFDQSRFSDYGHNRIRCASADDVQEDDRMLVLLLDLITSAEPVRLESYMDLLYISETTMDEVTAKLRKHIRKYGLSLKHRAYYGTVIAGSEFDIRRCFIDSFSLPFIESHARKTGTSRKDTQKLTSAFQKLIRNNAFEMSDEHFFMLVKYLIIARQRMNHGFEARVDVTASADESIQHALKKDIAELFECLDMNGCQGEADVLMMLMMSLRSDAGQLSHVSNNEMKMLISSLLKKTDRVFSSGFADDSDLIKGLMLHIIPMQYRSFLGTDILNPYKRSIMTEHPDAYDISCFFCSLLEKALGIKISDDEKAYISLHFEYSMSKRNASSKKEIYICIPHSKGISILIRKTIAEATGIPKKEIHIVSFFELKNMNASKDSIIISTGHLPFSTKAVFIHVSYPVTGKELLAVRAALANHSSSISTSRI